MAEPKVQYKFGLKSLSMDDYVRNIGNNVRSYIDYNIKHRGWTDDQVNEFTQSYDRYMKAMLDQLSGNTNRFSTNDLGDIVDSQGEFNNIDLGANGQPEEFYYNGKGERIDQSQYDALKDRKKKKYTTFNANREVAEFFRRVGTKMSEYKEPPKEKFDINKHGFVAWWAKKYNPSGAEAFIEPYLELDPVGADGRRPVTARALKAAGWLGEYLDYMKDQDLDYSDYSINNAEDYINRGRALLNEWNNGTWKPDDLILAQEYGISPNWSREFFSTEKDPRLSPEERQQQELLRQQQEALAAQRQTLELQQQQSNEALQWINEQIQAYQQGLTAEGFNSTPVNLTGNDLVFGDNMRIDPSTGAFVYGSDDISRDMQWLGGLGINLHNANGVGWNQRELLNLLKAFIKDPNGWMTLHRAGNNGAVGALIRLAIANNDPPFAKVITDGKYQGCYLLPSDDNTNLNRALIFDPQENNVKFVFIGDIPELWKQKTDAYLLEQGIDPNLINPADYQFNIPQHKEGGAIKLQDGGLTPEEQAFINSANKRHNDIRTQNANARQMSLDAYMRRSRPVSKGMSLTDAGNDDFNEIAGGWTARDYWQLGNIGADVFSLISAFAPGYGTVASAVSGAGSTVSQYIHDLTGGENFWSSTGNMLLGLGMDALGLIPGAGATSKGAKIAKNLIKYVPRIMATIGTMSTLLNAPQIMASLQKIKDDKDLTVDDWRNISQAIGLVTGLGGGAVRHQVIKHTSPTNTWLPKGRVRNFVQRPADTGDVAVQLRNKRTGIVETRRYTGDEARQLRAAQTPEAMEQIVFRNNPGLGEYEFVRGTSFKPEVKLAFWKSRAFSQDNPRAMVIRRSPTGQEYAENGKWSRDIPTTEVKNKTIGEQAYNRSVINDPGVKKALAESKVYEAQLQAKPAEVARLDADIAQLRANVETYKRNNGITGNLQDVNNQITTINSNRKGLTGVADGAFKQKQQRLTDVDAEIQRLEAQINQRRLRGANAKKANEDLAALKQELAELKQWLAQNDQAVLNDLDIHRQKLEDFDVQLNDLTSQRSNWDKYTSDGHTVAYTDLMSRVKNGRIVFTDKRTKSKFTKTEEDFKSFLKDLGIRYKEGGVLKAQLGNVIRNVTGNANWFEHMYSNSDNKMRDWLKTYNVNNYQDFNSLQDSWKANLDATNYTPGESAIYNEGVKARQPLWNNTGTNATIESLNTSGILTRHNGTSDNAAGNYTDGYFGAQEYLRHGGSHLSWQGHEDELQALKDQFRTQGLDYYEDENGMYKLRPLTEDPEGGGGTGGNPSVTNSQRHDDLEKPGTGLKNKLNNYMNPKWLAMALALYANEVNNRMTDRSLSVTRPVLQPPKNDTRYMQGNLDALMLGERADGQLMHIASQPVTSDGSLYAATMLDAAARGQEYVIQGRTTHNAALRTRAEEILKLIIEDHAFNYDVANKNRVALNETAVNRAVLLNSRDAKNYDNNTALFNEIMYDIKSDWNKRKNLRETLDKADIHSKVINNLSQYVTLTPEEESAWLKVISGQASASELTGDEALAYRSALKKASQAETNQLRILYGIDPVDYTTTTEEDPIKITPSHKSGGILVMKDGSKVHIAKIRARSRERIKDADRLIKSIKDMHDRTDKNIARADKKMYPINRPISSKRRYAL